MLRFLLLVAAVAASSTALPAQAGPLAGVLGFQLPTHGGEGGMVLAGDVRLAFGPRDWPLRPSVGVAAATDVFGVQGELLAGVQRTLVLGALELNGGLGYSRLGYSGGAATGSSNAGYAHGALVVRRGWGAGFGLDVRLLAGPDRRREDGLLDPVGFAQIGLVYLGRG